MVDNIKYWKQQSESTDKIGEYRQDEVIRFVVQHLKLSKSQTLLDVGCAKGNMLALLPAKKKVGVDFSMRYAKEARKNNPGARIVVAEAAQLPFGDGSFDRVLCHSLFHLMDIPYAKKVILELERVCRKKGRILIGDIPDMQDYPGGKLAYGIRTAFLERVGRPHYIMFKHGFFEERNYAIIPGPINPRFYAVKQK